MITEPNKERTQRCESNAKRYVGKARLDSLCCTQHKTTRPSKLANIAEVKKSDACGGPHYPSEERVFVDLVLSNIA
jgi:hypothetical protein